MINFEINPPKVFKILFWFIFFLLCMNLIGLILKYYYGIDSLFGLIELFDFNAEMNIPTFYSALTLIFASFLLFIFALIKKRLKESYFHWLGLAFIFLFLSIDEMVALHERIMWPVKELLNTSGILLFAWIIPYGLFILLLSIIYFKFILSLPKTTMFLFLLSAFTFLTGTIGFELLEGRHYELYGMNDILYSFLCTCEEFLEMLGVAIFIYALLSYAGNQFSKFTIKISKK